MSFIRRFTSIPTLAQESAIEGVNIIEQPGGGAVKEVQEGVALGLGECLKGPYNTPTEFQPNSETDFATQFGAYSPYLGVAPSYNQQGGTNGNLFVSFRGKTYVRNIACRVDLRCATTAPGGASSVLTFTIPIQTVDITIPAGTRVQAALTPGPGNAVVMTDQDIVIHAGLTTGTANAVNVSGLFPGTAGQSIAAGAVWTIVDTQNCPGGTAVTNVGSAVFPNPSIITAYTNALAACDTAVSPGADADIIWSAFVDPDSAVNLTNPTINWTGGLISSAIFTHCTNFRAHGKGRVGILMGQLGDPASIGVPTGPGGQLANSANNLSLKHSNYLFYAWPWVQQEIPEANAVLTVPPSAWFGCALASVNPEQNPGEPGIANIQSILGLETDIPAPSIVDYEALLAAGICGVFIQGGAVEFESGVTTDVAGTAIGGGNMTAKNRRFQDDLEDSLAGFGKIYAKKLRNATNLNRFSAALHRFLDGLESLDDTDHQRIAAYNLDIKTGNTKNIQGTGIFRVKVQVTQLDDFRDISFLMTVGEGVTIETT